MNIKNLDLSSLKQYLNKKTILLIVAILVIAIVVIKIAVKPDKGTIIDDYDENWIALNKKGEIVQYEQDSNGNVIIPELSNKALSKLGITKEVLKRMVNPYSITTDNNKKPIIFVYALYSDGKTLSGDVVIYGKEYEKDEQGLPRKDEQGNVIYIENPEQTDDTNNTDINDTNNTDNTNNTENTNESNKTGSKSESLDNENKNTEENKEISVSNEEVEELESTNKDQNKEIYVDEYEEDPKNVLELGENFFKRNKDWNTLKESPYRDLGIEPKSKADNPFIYYNWEGKINPYKFEGYLNRFIYGIAFNYTAIEKGFNYKLNKLNNNDLLSPSVSISIDINKDDLLKEFKKAWIIIKDMDVFPELDDASLDNLSYIALDKVKQYITMTSDESLKYYEKKDYNYRRSDNGRFQWMYDTRIDMIEKMKKMNLDALDDELLTRLRVLCLQRLIQERYDTLRKDACSELNEYKEGSCKDWKEITPLEIRSDFIQMMYELALRDSTKLFVTMVQDIQGQLRSVELSKGNSN